MRSTASHAHTEILAAAAQRFAVHGYEGASLSDIAADLGRSKAAVLYHFKTKGAILRELVGPPTLAFRALVERCEQLPPGEARLQTALGFVDVAFEHRDALSGYPAPLRMLPRIAELADLKMEDIGRRLVALLAEGVDPVQDEACVRVLFHGILTSAFLLVDAPPDDALRALRTVALRILDLPASANPSTDTKARS